MNKVQKYKQLSRAQVEGGTKVQRSSLSVIIIAKNQEGVIEECLESVKWADEVVVLDTGSIDKTIEIAQKYTKIVYEYEAPSGLRPGYLLPTLRRERNPSEAENSSRSSTSLRSRFSAKGGKKSNEIDFSAWRNYALQFTHGDWLLYVDTDERVTPLLKQEILSITSQQPLATNHNVAFAIPRRNIRLGKEMHYGGWWPDYVLRLVRKDNLVKWEGKLHEQPVVDGSVGKLVEPFVHYSHRGSFENKLENTIKWSGLEAGLLYESGHPPMNIKRFLGAMGREFYKRMIKYQAWRDGTEGILEAIYQVFSVFITYARLWEMQRKEEPSFAKATEGEE